MLPTLSTEGITAALASLVAALVIAVNPRSSRQIPQRYVFVLCPTCGRNLDQYHERRPIFQPSPIRVQTSKIPCSRCAR